MRIENSEPAKKHYVITIVKIRESEGGGWMASIPQLGPTAFSTGGETPEEALDNLSYLTEDLLTNPLDEDEVPISVDEYSQMPPRLERLSHALIVVSQALCNAECALSDNPGRSSRNYKLAFKTAMTILREILDRNAARSRQDS